MKSRYYRYGCDIKKGKIISWQERKQTTQKRTSLEEASTKRLDNRKATIISQVSKQDREI
jgi:hypothetical protein